MGMFNDPEQSFVRRQERAALAQKRLGIAGAQARLVKSTSISVRRRLKRAGARLPIRSAAITTPGKALAVRAVTSFLGPGRGQQAQAVLRQTIAKPLVKPVAIGAALTGGAFAFESATGRSPGRAVFDLTQRGAGRPFQQQQQPAGRKPQMPRGNLQVGQELPPSHVVVRTWQTFPGGPVFARLADGHIAVQKKDGTIKHFRPYRPVVIPRKWNARSMSRVATALKRQRKTATKIMKITGGMPKGRG